MRVLVERNSQKEQSDSSFWIGYIDNGDETSSILNGGCSMI
jgi:hypothetical protein